MTATTLATRVRSVTVFRRGALVTREGELLGGSVPDQIVIEALPLSLDDSSLRVELLGEGAVPVASDVRITLAVPGPDPTLAPPDDAELEQAELTLAQVQREFDRLHQALAALGRLEPSGRGLPKKGEAPDPSPLAARMELLAFRRERNDALVDRIAAVEERHRVASERVATARERIRVASQARNVRTHEVRKAAVIRLEAAAGSGNVRVRLSYFVAGARWAPAYTIRLDRALTSAELDVRAMVGQNTGEDWSNVELTLSTASPQQWTELPQLRARKIGRAQPEPAKTGWRPAPVGAGELYADYDRDLAGRRPAPPPQGGAPARPVSRRERTADLLELHEDEAPEYAATRGAPPPPPSYAGPVGGPAAAPAAFGGMPMPMPMAPPQRMRASAPKHKGIGAMVGSALAGFGGSPEDTGAMAALPAEEQAFREPELVAGRDLLDYGRLRMFAATDHLRGSLRRIDLRMVYRQLITTELSFDLAYSRLELAAATAHRFESIGAPALHHFAVGEGGFDHAYVADGTLDLPSDGNFHSLAIKTATAKAVPRYVTVPREAQDVFRIVALINPLGAPLLPGPADVYVAGRFALTSDVQLTPIGGRLELGLGVEQSIKIARNVKYEEDTAGLIKRQHALIHTVSIDITNNLASSATVEVRERLPTVPVGVEAEIQVALREVRPQWQDFAQKPTNLEGGRAWIVEVEAGTKQTLQATWVISIPNQHELIGGNRRES